MLALAHPFLYTVQSIKLNQESNVMNPKYRNYAMVEERAAAAVHQKLTIPQTMKGNPPIAYKRAPTAMG